MSFTDAKIHTKDIIAAEALKLFVGQGYHNTSIPDIVKATGLSTGAVYHHFEGKEQLARYIHETATARFIEKFDRFVRPEPEFQDKIRAFVRMMFLWDDEDPVMVKYLITDRPAEILNRKTTVCSVQGLRLVGEIVSLGLTSQQIPADNYFMAVSLMSGSIIHFINLKKDGYIKGPLSEKADDFAGMIYNALSGK